MTEEEAGEILTCLWIKTLTINKIEIPGTYLKFSRLSYVSRMLRSADRHRIRKMR